MLLVILTAWLFRRVAANTADRIFRRMQLVSAALYSLGHGGNDAQKTMGIIAVLLYLAGHARRRPSTCPFWVVITCQAAMGLGTLMGGWRIVHTMGSKITRLTPAPGRSAPRLAARSCCSARPGSAFRSRPPTPSPAAIMGVGAARRASAVRWGVAGNIVIAWFITIPACGRDRGADLRADAAVLGAQHSTTLTARPPRLVSL